jgi:CBS domain-containing protein
VRRGEASRKPRAATTPAPGLRRACAGRRPVCLERAMHMDAGMRAGELCIRNVATATANESAVDAARRMAELRVGDLIVVEPRPHALPTPIGIITDRDLVVRVLARTDRAPATTSIGEVMRSGLVTATEDDDVEEIVSRMRDHAIRRIPIVDDRGGLQGILSLDDVLGWMRDQIQAATRLLERQGEGPLLHATLR